MKKLKIGLVFVFIFSLSFMNISYATYSAKDLIISKNKLTETTKGQIYYDKFTTIIEKYKSNIDVLLLLKNKINVLKIKVANGNYSGDLKNLILYMDTVINYYIEKLSINTIEKTDNSDEETKEDESVSNNEESEQTTKEEEPEEKIEEYPGFSQEYDDIEKNITSGENFIIFSGKTSSKYESVDVGSVKFYIEGADISNIKKSISSLNLYFEGIFIESVGISSIDILSSTKATVTFKKLSNFIVPQKEVSFRLGITTNSIGYEKLGKTIKGLYISKVSLYDAVGVNSGNNINAFTTTISTEGFSIVPGLPIVSVISDLNDSTIAKFNIKGIFGNNTLDSSNAIPTLKINKIFFKVYDNSDSTIYKLVNSNDSSDQIIGLKTGTKLEFDLSSMKNKNKRVSDGKGENYELYIQAATQSVFLEMLKDGINYDVEGIEGSDNLTINMSENINFGYRDF